MRYVLAPLPWPVPRAVQARPPANARLAPWTGGFYLGDVAGVVTYGLCRAARPSFAAAAIVYVVIAVVLRGRARAS